MKHLPFRLARLFSLFRDKRPVVDYEQIFKGPARPSAQTCIETREPDTLADVHGEICFREVFIHPVF